MRSASNYSFADVPRVETPRSVFNRDRTLKTAFDAGMLIPFYWDEVYPGDTFNVNSTVFGRLSTPVCPFMDNLYLDVHYFFVPYRLLWRNWNKMLGEQDNPDDSTDYLVPVMFTGTETNRVRQVSVGSLADYFGFPVGSFQSPGLEMNCFLFRAYNKIWNDHFRDENLQDSVYFNDGDQNDDLSKFKLLHRGKRKDYFTSCLPWPQKGPGAEISIGSSAPVFGTGNALSFANYNPASSVVLAYPNTNISAIQPAFTTTLRPANQIVTSSQTAVNAVNRGALGVLTRDQASDLGFSDVGLFADLSQATPISINDFRQAFQLQRWMERSARSGTRAPEIILGHFGVVCPDFRLQRSEFLGGGEVPIQVHQVAQNSSTDSTSPQGNMAAYGVMSGRCGFSKSFVEHGVVIGLASVRADLNYQQGMERSWSRRSKFDFYWPELAHLGEQAVLNKEIFADGSPADDQAYGYQERWAELRYGISHITGKLRSGINGSLDVWHLAQYFEDRPTLSDAFIRDNPPLARVLALQGEPQIIFDSLTKVNCARPLPMYSFPGLIDHL